MQRRRRYFLPHSEQPGLLRTLLLIWLLVTVAAAVLLYLGANRNIEDATYRAHFRAMRATGQVFLPFLLGANLVAAIGVFVLALFYTHRVAGPIYQIERRLAEVRDGNLKVTFRVRKHDRFRSLADALNEATGSMRVRLERGRHAADRVESAEISSDPASTNERENAIKDLRQALEELSV